MGKSWVRAWPSKWFIAIKGFLDAKDIALAVVKPTNNPPNKPGPAVAAIASILSIDKLALFIASLKELSFLYVILLLIQEQLLQYSA